MGCILLIKDGFKGREKYRIIFAVLFCERFVKGIWSREIACKHFMNWFGYYKDSGYGK